MHTTVLFDLDDTIFDHQYCRRCALSLLASCFEITARADLRRLEALHEGHLQATHTLLLDGKMSLSDARRERTRRLFQDLGVELSPEQLDEADSLYRETYDASRRAVPGAVELIRALAGTVKVGVVTNGLVTQQGEKLKLCGVDGLIDCAIVSEEVATRKPDRRIFDIALERLGASAPQAIVIGDSWKLDVVGARNAGLPAIWFNRYGEECPEPGTVVEVSSLEPVERIIEIIMG